MQVKMFRRLVALTVGGLMALLAGCGAGSGRSGTDLAVTGVGPATALKGGDAVSFTMTVSNRGAFDAKDLVLRNATLQVAQAGLTITCSASTGAACPATTGATMEVARLPSGASLVFVVNSTINVGASGTVSNTLAVSSDTADVDSDNNSATVSTTATSHDVAVQGTPPPGPLVDGTASFTMLVSNAGPDAAQDVVLATTVSPNLTLVPSAIACTPADGATAPALQDDGTLRVASLPAGATLNCSVPVTVAAGTSGVTAVSMTATSAGDSRAGNDTATASVTATLVHDLTVSGVASASSVVGGGSVVFTLTVRNAGPSTALDVVLANTLSADLSLLGVIACAPSGGATAPVATLDGNLIASAIPANGVLTCTVPVTVAAGANGLVFTTFSATSSGDQRPGDNSATVSTTAVSSNLGVSQTGAAQVAAGTATTFTARVNNPGPGTASNVVVTWTTNAPAGVVFDPPTCTALAGATCPATLGPSMTVPTLAAGRTLVFSFTATPGAGYRGDIVNTVVVAADEDIDLGNNSATTTTAVVDPRSGSYKVFAAHGRQYDLALSFETGTYTMSGHGESTVTAFSGGGPEYTVAGNARFRLATDMVVGGHDFGGGVLPYVAVRSFTSGLAALAGSYNLATRNIAADGTATTLAGTAFITGNTLSICESEDSPVTTVRLCVSGARRDYVNLTIDGNVVTGTSAAGETIRFSVATSGAAKFFLLAGDVAGGGQRLRVGVVDSTGGIAFGPPQSGASTTGDWVEATLVDTLPVGYTAVGSTTSDSASLVAVTSSGAGPFSMLIGTSTTYNGSIYVLASYPLLVVVGGPVLFSPASGLLYLSLP
jgi:uncharacterized repeat protein (TIGR01451 family)